MGTHTHSACKLWVLNMANEVWKGVFVEEGCSLIAIHTIHTLLGGPLPRSLVLEFKVGYQPYVISYLVKVVLSIGPNAGA